MALPGGKKSLLLALAGLLAAATARGGDTASVQAALAVLTNQNCRFSAPAVALDFGTLVAPATVADMVPTPSPKSGRRGRTACQMRREASCGSTRNTRDQARVREMR